MFVLDKQASGKMDDGGHRENRRHRMDYYKIPPWNMLPQYQAGEQNAFDMNAKISMIYYERDAAIEERDRALNEKKVALEERNVAVQQRDIAYAERDNALRERDNAIAALQFQESSMKGVSGSRGLKRINHPTHHHFIDVHSGHISKGGCIADAVPVTTISAEDAKSHETKEKMKRTVATKSPKKAKKLGEDLNRHVTTDGSKAEWDAQDFGTIDQIQFDETSMPVPVCSCTGVPRQCYKWGSGGWQSSCCTTTLSVYPLPQMPNKRHARMGGRKMSGSVFSRLLTKLVATGHEVSNPVDLKNYWAKHGTNRYVTIK